MLWRAVKALFYSWNNIQIKLDQPQCECDFPYSRPACVSMVKISSETLCWLFLKTFLLPSGFFCWICATVGLASAWRADLTFFRSESVWVYRPVYFWRVAVFIFVLCHDSACVVVGPTQRGENTSLNESLELPAINESLETLFFFFLVSGFVFHCSSVRVSFSFNFVRC